MKKNDLFVILSICLIALISFLLFFSKEEVSYANVYYDGDLIIEIDLSVNDSYIVDGYNGEVLIVVENSKIKVEEEMSPLHICSKQGFVDTVNEPIICLPNKIVIELSGNNEIDAIVK